MSRRKLSKHALAWWYCMTDMPIDIAGRLPRGSVLLIRLHHAKPFPNLTNVETPPYVSVDLDSLRVGMDSYSVRSYGLKVTPTCYLPTLPFSDMELNKAEREWFDAGLELALTNYMAQALVLR